MSASLAASSIASAQINRRRWLAAAATLVSSGWAPGVVARSRDLAPPLVLAQEAPADIDPAGFLVSEKYDGVRACWDGHTLRFRSGLPIAAPAWFTVRLPAVALDGELWVARGHFEAASAAVRRLHPDDAEWQQLHYKVFELPGAAGDFAQRAARIERITRDIGWAPLQAVAQAPVIDRSALQRRLQDVVRAGGEGLVLHRADAVYVTGRSGVLQKLKPVHDAEAVVVEQLPGRGKHAGRLGALRVRTPDGVEFRIGTGFSDAQRAQAPSLGSVISYTHRGHTEGGVPRFASFLRVQPG